MGDNLNLSRGAAAGDDAPPVALGRAAYDEPVRVGVPYRGLRRARLSTYDRGEGIKTKSEMSMVVTTPDRLDEDWYRERCEELEKQLGLSQGTDAQKHEFYEAMYITYALVSGSQLTPGNRASFQVMGVKHDWSVIQDFWGEHLRRAFRVVADYVVEACKDVIENVDTHNDYAMMIRQQLLQAADMRGLSRKPWLVADCAEKAFRLTQEEKLMIQQSKSLVIGATFNAVDRRNMVIPIHSAEGYDSSNGQVMGSAYGGSSGNRTEYR